MEEDIRIKIFWQKTSVPQHNGNILPDIPLKLRPEVLRHLFTAVHGCLPDQYCPIIINKHRGRQRISSPIYADSR
jgi:hypothetical protein